MLARKLAARGHSVGVVAPGPGPTVGEGYRIARMAGVPFPIYPELRMSTSLLRVRRIARSRAWDGAIVLTPGPIGVATAMALPRTTRLVNVYTTDIPRYLATYSLERFSPWAERGLRWMARRSVRTLCPTEHVREELASRGYVRLETWGRGVDADLFDPRRRCEAMRARLSGGHPEAPIVLFVGRLAREKRIADVHRAAELLPGARFAFVGDGPERTRLEELFAGMPAVFTGYLRGEELATAFASADVFVFPSDTDTFGQVVLQAMACGVPPVVVGGTATAEFVPAGVAGMHVAPGRPEAIACAVNRLITEPALRASMGIAARECARRYSWDALMERMEGYLHGETTASSVSLAGRR